LICIVGDVRHFGLDADPVPEVYLPYAASPLYAPILVIRTDADPTPILQSLAGAVRSVNPGLAVYNVFRMRDLVERSTAQRRFAMLLFTAFAGAALLLAAIGIYGAVSHSVLHRTPEIGLRMALGATPSAVMGVILRQGLVLGLEGAALGSIAAFELARLMRSMLFQVSTLDPVVFAAAALTLGLLTLLACYVPARRAAAVDPMVALRRE
jgi:putative ABC transport system permease protein